jgi:hypothetical protein
MTTKSGPVIHVTPGPEPAPAGVAAAQPFTPPEQGPAPTSTVPGATVETLVGGAGLLLAIAAAFVIERRRRCMASERPSEAKRVI